MCWRACQSSITLYLHVASGLLVDWLDGWGLTSHSAIFQLYSDERVVQFPNLDLLTGTQCHRQQGVFSVTSLPRHRHQDIWRCLLPPCHQRAHTRWGYTRNQTRIVRSTVQPATSMPPRQAALGLLRIFNSTMYMIINKEIHHPVMILNSKKRE